jgi:hypothetical protein
MGQGEGEEGAESREVGDQVPLELDPVAYVQLGRVAMVQAPGGGALPAGEPPAAAQGLTKDSLICLSDGNGRQACQHYVALLTPAEGQFRGGKHQMLRLRRFCTRLASQSELMDLTDSEVFACTMREPRDEQSLRLIEDFERRQRELTGEIATEQKTVDI